MAVPTESMHNVSVRLSATGQPPVRDGASSGRVITVLFGTGIEEWRRGWRSSPNSGPAREAIVSAGDTTRGATATTQVVPGGRLAYTVLDASATLDRVTDAVSTHVDDAAGEPLSMIVDDITPVVTDRGVSATRSFIASLRELSGVDDIVVGCSYGPEVATGIRSLFDPIEDVERVDHPVAETVDRLRRDDPTTFGYVRRHWAEAREGVERCTRNYPQSRQVHAALSDPETTPRTLGAALSGLVRLGVLDTWGETVGPTRYDLTAYDPDRMWVVGAALASSDETDAGGRSEADADGGAETDDG
ncbi:hypothetical protein [Halorubrum sp. CBA1229]|uniref:hypothetical protein n=1 Tax=Halorubrum sp. CBA1229 TaxID=1853699 RepID=UPI000F401E20|nr:hypothetical protein [Halorubrum sp. CBA1229]QKY17964.1 hypothetical protein Hrr1229_014155 [Halorubrum sp. CBA1229]